MIVASCPFCARSPAALNPAGPLPTIATSFVVGYETLEVADRQGFETLTEEAGAFTLILLRADAAGDGGEDVVFANLCGGSKVVFVPDQRDELFDFDADRATLRACGASALQAAFRFKYC